MSEIVRPWAHEGDNWEILVPELPQALYGGWTPGEQALLRAAGRAWEMTRPRLAERLGLSEVLEEHPAADGRCSVIVNGRRCRHGAHYRVTSGCVNEHLPVSDDCSCCLEVFRAGVRTGATTCTQCGEPCVIVSAEPLHEAQDDGREELIG